MKTKTSLVLSINVHENVGFLLRQLNNFKEYMVEDYQVVLSCNDYMYNELKNTILPDNVIINPEAINKKVLHGSLTQGICSNMKFSYEIFDFLYFVILSSRNLFYNKLTISHLDSKQLICDNVDSFYKEREITNNIRYDWGPGLYDESAARGWHWWSFFNTRLSNYFMSKNMKLSSSAHEGLVFHNNVCNNILCFLEENNDIQSDLFTHEHCIEEFSLQTIACNLINQDNKYHGFIYIGHGTDTQHVVPSEPDLFVYKTIRI